MPSSLDERRATRLTELVTSKPKGIQLALNRDLFRDGTAYASELAMVTDALLPQELSMLEEKVRTYRVVYEITTAERIVDGEKRAIGFDVILCGTHRDSAAHVLPGCSRCEEVYQVLKTIAQAIVPGPGRASRYSIRGFDRAFHQTPQRNLRKDIELVIEIRHREGYLKPVDACERRCLDEIKDNLRTLSVPFKRWNI